MPAHHMPSILKRNECHIPRTFARLFGPSDYLAIQISKVVYLCTGIVCGVSHLEVVDNTRASNKVDD